MENYSLLGAIGVAKLLPGRSRDTIKQWAHKNGLKVSKEYRSEVTRQVNYKHKRNMSDATRERIGNGHRKYDPFVCAECGKPISHYRTRCLSCYRASKTDGQRNNNWRGGVSALSKIISTALKEIWKKPILIRDNFTCQDCGATRHFNVHHVRRLVDIRDMVIKANPHLKVTTVEGKFELAKLIVAEHTLADGITLCKKCHILRHSKQRGELLETPERDNQQPSPPNLKMLVGGKVQRLTGEESETDKPDTSAPHEEPSSRRDSLSLQETVRSKA